MRTLKEELKNQKAVDDMLNHPHGRFMAIFRDGCALECDSFKFFNKELSPYLAANVLEVSFKAGITLWLDCEMYKGV